MVLRNHRIQIGAPQLQKQFATTRCVKHMESSGVATLIQESGLMSDRRRKVFSNKRSRAKLQTPPATDIRDLVFILDAFENMKLQSNMQDPTQRLVLIKARKIVQRCLRKGLVPVAEMRELESIAVLLGELQCTGRK